MERATVTCEQCGQPYTARIRGDGSVVLPTESGDCERCGGTEFSPLVDEAATDD
ncbi:hypothetical protein [Haladaptatus sp. NG-SE-30]